MVKNYIITYVQGHVVGDRTITSLYKDYVTFFQRLFFVQRAEARLLVVPAKNVCTVFPEVSGPGQVY